MGLQQQVRGTDVVLAAVFEERNLGSGWGGGGQRENRGFDDDVGCKTVVVVEIITFYF